MGQTADRPGRVTGHCNIGTARSRASASSTVREACPSVRRRTPGLQSPAARIQAKANRKTSRDRSVGEKGGGPALPGKGRFSVGIQNGCRVSRLAIEGKHQRVFPEAGGGRDGDGRHEWGCSQRNPEPAGRMGLPVPGKKYHSSEKLLAGADFEHLRAAMGSSPGSGRFPVLHGHGGRLLHLFFRLTLDAICFHYITLLRSPASLGFRCARLIF